MKMSDKLHCSDMCYSYWVEHPFSQHLFCPSCTMWTDENGDKKMMLNIKPSREWAMKWEPILLEEEKNEHTD